MRLWCNEFSRVFFDRLVTEEDRSVVQEHLDAILQQFFPESHAYATRNPLVFGGFEKALEQITGDVDDSSRLYGDMGDLTRVRTIFDGVLENYNKVNSKTLKLVLFEMALSHLVRLMRILKTPRGHALLIGIGGSGKRSLAKLAAYASGYELFEISLTRGYKESDFREDLKTMYTKLTRGPVVFLFSDVHIVDEGFLEYINNILCTGIHPGLLEGEDKEAACNLLRTQAKISGIHESANGLWQYFVETCRSNLHIILAMSPSGEKLRLRCRNFPGLVSACTIDWFLPWPRDALEQVAASFLKNEKDIFQGISADRVMRQVVLMHELATKMAHDFHAATKRTYYVTPKHYLDFICSFKDQLYSDTNKVRTSIKRLEGGLTKLEEAAVAVDRMQEELKEKKVSITHSKQLPNPHHFFTYRSV